MKILVTAIGSMASECVIEALVQMGINVVATDIYPREYHPIATKCCAFYQVPRVYPNENLYCKTVRDIAVKESCEVIMPLTDPEVDVISKNRRVFERLGIMVWLAADEVIKKVRNKAFWAQELEDCVNFKIIPSFQTYAELKANYEGDFVAKKNTGRSSEGIVFSNTSIFQIDAKFEDDYLFQPKISGEVLTVDFVKHPKSAQLIFIPRIELMRTKNGAGTVVKIANIDLCRTAIREIVDRLDLIGVMNCEFICGVDGLYLMDINPRFSAGVSFSKLAGYDFIKANVNCFCSDCIDDVDFVAEGNVFVKRFCDF